MSTVHHTSARLGLGLRLTGPRRAVLDAVNSTTSPFTVEDICEAIPDVGRATVFRTMKLLQELELVCRVPLEDGSVRYQRSHGGHHHHLICSACGRVTDFDDAGLDALIAEQARARRFRLDSHSLELYGLCGNCVR